MHRVRTLLILGIWVTVLPYLGFPYSWKDILFSVSGLGLIYFSYVFYNEFKENDKQKKTFDSFRENNNFDKKNNESDMQTEEVVE
jgi:hypothetical protein